MSPNSLEDTTGKEVSQHK